MDISRRSIMLKAGLISFVSAIVYSQIAHGKDFPFRNVSLTWDERVDDLVSRLTIADIMYQMAKGGAGIHGGPAPAIPRLGIEPWAWNTECLHGDSYAGEATGFPQAIGLAAAFNPSLIHDIAEATSIEVRAKHSDFVKKKQYGDHKGLSCFSPVINIMRHPLWGRNQETYGEDPYMSGELARHFVQGLQGTDQRYVRASAGCKHFNVHGGPENIPTSRFSFDSKVSEFDWRTTFLPAFRQCVLAGSYSIMCSFNEINGVPACANHKLLTEILRGEWKFNGYVISDEEAVENLVLYHHYSEDSIQAAVESVKAGLNIEITTSRIHSYFLQIENAVKKGMLDEILVRERVKPLFYTRMRLGEFDPPSMVPYTQYNLSVVQSPDHRALALKAAMQTFVLLKNKNLLPIKKKFDKIAVVGPMADNVEQLYGSYRTDIDRKYVKTPREGLKGIADTVQYAAGCKDNKCTDYYKDGIKRAITGSKLTVICVGTGQELESEGNDRHSMDLPGKQEQLVKDAISYSKGSPVLLLVFSGGPINISFADRSEHVDAIMQCFFPAQAAGEALFNTLTMATDDACPAGRLPYTWYDTADQVRPITDYSMDGRTYRYFKGTPLYPFGYGLSYTTFEYSDLTYRKSIRAGDDQYVFAIVENTGSIDADEVVQVYMSWKSAGKKMPKVQLVGFKRLFLAAKSTQSVKFTITSEQMAIWTDNGWTVKSGTMEIYIGGQQPNQENNVGSNILSGTFTINGQTNLGKY